MTLAAGRYIFLLSAPVAGQVVIEVYNGDASKLIAACVGIESDLLKQGGDSLAEYPRTTPVALRAWFHPDSPRGYAFVYGPEEAARIFAASASPVPSTIHGDSEEEMRLGLLPIGHADERYDRQRGEADAAEPLQPSDLLTLARLSIVAHIDSLPSDVAQRLRLLYDQIRDVETADPADAADVDLKLQLVKASLVNMPAGPDRNAGTFVQLPALTEVLDSVRARVKAFEDFRT